MLKAKDNSGNNAKNYVLPCCYLLTEIMLFYFKQVYNKEKRS